MRIRTLALLMLPIMTGEMAAAGDAPAPAPAPVYGTPTSLGSLLDGGYEIRVALPISDADQKAIWPNDPVSPFMLVILQKGASVATCVWPMTSWINLSPEKINSASGACRKS